MPRKGENIYKRKDGRWEGRYIKFRDPNGLSKYGYVYGKTYRGVKDRLTDEKNRIKLSITDKNDSENCILFGSVADEWFRSILPGIKESSSVKYQNLLLSYILPVWGHIALTDISHDKLETFFHDLLVTGGINKKGLSPKSVSDILSLMRSILRYASDTGKVVPCDGRSIHIKRTDKEIRILSRAEQATLCKYLYANLNKKSIGILICLFTGLRVGEICALRWEDTLLSEKTIYVRQTMQRIQTRADTGPKTKIIVTPPKSSCSVRRIPIPDNLMMILAEQPHYSTGYFLTDSSEKFIEPRTMQNYLKRVLKNSGVEEINFHALRHTFATRCIELGFDVKCLSEILGHADVNITMNRYVHPSMELKCQNMQLLSDLFTVK